MNKLTALSITTLLGALLSHSANADVGIAARAGTLGFGVDFDIGLTETLNLRLGYNALNYDYEFEDTDVTYDGKLKIGAASAILDWYAFNGGFHFSLGAVQKGPELEVVGKPTGSSYEINGRLYSAAEVGSLTGKIEIGDSVAPYIGVGWGNTVDKAGRVTFLLDVGVIKTGSPTATLEVNCGPAVPTIRCNQLRNDVAAEKAELEDESDSFELYPVVTVGVGIRF